MGGDTTDQAAAADCDQHGIELRRLPIELEADRSLSAQRFHRIVGMHFERTGSLRSNAARVERFA